LSQTRDSVAQRSVLVSGLLGGKVTVIKQKEATSFERSRRNGVTTMESKARSGTFLFGGM